MSMVRSFFSIGGRASNCYYTCREYNNDCVWERQMSNEYYIQGDPTILYLNGEKFFSTSTKRFSSGGRGGNGHTKTSDWSFWTGNYDRLGNGGWNGTNGGDSYRLLTSYERGTDPESPEYAIIPGRQGMGSMEFNTIIKIMNSANHSNSSSSPTNETSVEDSLWLPCLFHPLPNYGGGAGGIGCSINNKIVHRFGGGGGMQSPWGMVDVIMRDTQALLKKVKMVLHLFSPVVVRGMNHFQLKTFLVQSIYFVMLFTLSLSRVLLTISSSYLSLGTFLP
jgi:hypothetical protein